MTPLESTGFGMMLGQLNRVMRGAALVIPAEAITDPVVAPPTLGQDRFVRSPQALSPAGNFVLNAQGPAVASLQNQLIALGYLAGTPDGIYGPGTAQAVWYFQQDYGRAPTGTCDASDLAMMEAVLRGQVPRRRPVPVAPVAPSPFAGPVHRIQGGETLSDLAQWYLGDSRRWPELMVLNHDQVRDPNRLVPGQFIRLPAGSQPPLITLPPVTPAPVTPPPVTPPVTQPPSGQQNALGARAVEIAKQYLGVRYVWGGTTPDGFDCSGLMKYVYRVMGIAIPRVAADQFKAGKAVNEGDLKPGDAVFFKNTGSRTGITHVGMYIGNGRFLHAPKTGDVVKISDLNESYYKAHYAGARRYVD